MNRLLKIGDCFRLKRGLPVYMDIPSRFIFTNRPKSNEVIRHEVTLGDSLAVPGDKNCLDRFHTDSWIGEYVVVRVGWSGGGVGHGPHDIYPDGWQVVALQIRDGKADHSRVISFYQDTNCYTASIYSKDIILLDKHGVISTLVDIR